MEIHPLRSFVVLAEHLHFGRAAQALHISQPALTKQIRKLEGEIGAPLFERGPGATRLSAIGAHWLPEVQATVTRMDALARSVRLSVKGETGRLRVGFGYHTLEIVPALVAKLRASSPEIGVTLRDMSTAEQAAALAAGDLDIGFMRMPIADAANYSTLPVVEDRLALVLPRGHARRRAVKLAELSGAAFISISRVRSPGFFNHVLGVCAAQGFHPRLVQEVYEFTTAIALVRAGMGATFIPRSLWTGPMPGVELHELDDRRARWKVAAVWRRRDTNPVLKNFVRLLGEASLEDRAE